eukprot:5091844-Prymnesium_polylepis.3
MHAQNVHTACHGTLDIIDESLLGLLARPCAIVQKHEHVIALLQLVDLGRPLELPSRDDGRRAQFIGQLGRAFVVRAAEQVVPPALVWGLKDDFACCCLSVKLRFAHAQVQQQFRGSIYWAASFFCCALGETIPFDRVSREESGGDVCPSWCAPPKSVSLLPLPLRPLHAQPETVQQLVCQRDLDRPAIEPTILRLIGIEHGEDRATSGGGAVELLHR